MMSSLKKSKINFPVREFIQKGSLSELNHISDEEFIQLIVKPLNLQPKRRIIAIRQLRIYFNKISSRPDMKLLYLRKIKELFQFEKGKGVIKNE